MIVSGVILHLIVQIRCSIVRCIILIHQQNINYYVRVVVVEFKQITLIKILCFVIKLSQDPPDHLQIPRFHLFSVAMSGVRSDGGC